MDLYSRSITQFTSWAIVFLFLLSFLSFTSTGSGGCEDDGDGNGYFISTVYLFLESQRIAGCLVAEQIKKAYKILSSSKGGGHRSTGTKDARPNSTTVQFGEVIFHREVTRNRITSYKVLEGTSVEPYYVKRKLSPLAVASEPFGSVPATEDTTLHTTVNHL